VLVLSIYAPHSAFGFDSGRCRSKNDYIATQ